MFKLFLSINTEAIFDTLSANHVAETLYWQLSNECFINIIDMGYKIGTIIITIINLIYIIKINNFRKKSSKIQQKKEQKIDLFKTIVISPNLNKMYKFFDDLWSELKKLKLKDCPDKNMENIKKVKGEIEPKVQILFTCFRSEFIIIIDAIAPSLGQKIENISDEMRDKIIENMGDEGINLWVDKYFNDRIKKIYDDGRKKMVNALFEYNGDE